MKWDRATALKPLVGNLTRAVTVTYPQLQCKYTLLLLYLSSTKLGMSKEIILGSDVHPLPKSKIKSYIHQDKKDEASVSLSLVLYLLLHHIKANINPGVLAMVVSRMKLWACGVGRYITSICSVSTPPPSDTLMLSSTSQ